MIEFPKRVPHHNSAVFMLLINVIFLLIVFFLVAGTIKKPDFYPVNVPASENADPQIEPEAFITISKDGKITIGSETVSEDKLKSALHEVFAIEKGRTVPIKADSELDAKKLIHVINLVRKAGGENISLITRNYKQP